ncbi:MAG: helix-turn-helix transcriptional regulator [Ruminococcaceae bacterium]|nr:helix-turn-helix transcriptional regulator [Oscillospiraceae bacterium]
MDVHARLRQILKEQGWSRYRLAKECGLSESTITNIFKRGNVPTIGTLEIMCKSMHITLAQFFAENDLIELSPELKKLYEEWAFLNPEQKEAILQMIRTMRKNK